MFLRLTSKTYGTGNYQQISGTPLLLLSWTVLRCLSMAPSDKSSQVNCAFCDALDSMGTDFSLSLSLTHTHKHTILNYIQKFPAMPLCLLPCFSRALLFGSHYGPTLQLVIDKEVVTIYSYQMKLIWFHSLFKIDTAKSHLSGNFHALHWFYF